MKMGQGIQLEMTNPDNVTLAYMPFTAPLNSTSAKLQITKASWRTECDPKIIGGETLAVAGDKFYYICQVKRKHDRLLQRPAFFFKRHLLMM